MLMAGVLMRLMFLPCRRECFSTKWLASSRMSVFLARSGGRLMGKTFSLVVERSWRKAPSASGLLEVAVGGGYDPDFGALRPRAADAFELLLLDDRRSFI
jgi:hypothetical protein